MLLEYDLCLRAIRRDFALTRRATQIDRRELLMLDNPHHVERSRIANKSHLLGVKSGDQSLEFRTLSKFTCLAALLLH